ncbi:MAG: methyl-accepting chemotaxis protein [Deltaproteobacteria bacterium]|nr:methyl-accepting chemotaxis protein [Deltaproteobacteria bacterium]
MKISKSNISLKIFSGTIVMILFVIISTAITITATSHIKNDLHSMSTTAESSQPALINKIDDNLGFIKAAQIIAMLITVTMILSVALLFKNSLLKPLHEIIGVVERIGQGDTSYKLPMGTPVNCSSIKNCGIDTCPSFGKTDPCWVTSGSYAVIKHCPKAKQGLDCRDCDIYGAHNEIEELGSIVNSISNNLELRTKLALKIAGGDLTHEVEIASEKDFLGKSLQKMTKNLSSLIGKVKSSTVQVASGSEEISASSQALSSGAVQSAAALEQISSSMTEISHQLHQNSRNISEADKLTIEAKSAAVTGNKRMNEMIEAMNEINNSSKDINKIIKVIDDIAFQTNLLALNAAVEAARAGKYGKGFAVVAEEVRTLAARSAKAASETSELIEGSVSKSKRGTEIAKQTAGSLEGIVSLITDLSRLVTDINQTSVSQANAITQINSGLEQIDQVVQANSASAEEGASSSEELASQAELLRSQLSQFTLHN